MVKVVLAKKDNVIANYITLRNAILPQKLMADVIRFSTPSHGLK